MPRVLAILVLSAALGCGESSPSRPSNRPPALAAVSDTTIAVGSSLELTARAEDPEGGPVDLYVKARLRFEELLLGTGPAITFNGETGLFRFAAAESDRPSRIFTFVAVDAEGLRDSVLFEVTVP